MSDTDHSKRRRVNKIRREGSNRAQVRQALTTGNYDELPASMPTRLIRTNPRSGLS